jgi:HEAT repeat protein
MTTQFTDKTIRFLGKTENPSSIELLVPLLDSTDDEARSLAFDALYKKKDPDIYVTLFNVYAKKVDTWSRFECVNEDRLTKLADTALRDKTSSVRKRAAEIILEYKLYGTLPTVVRYLEGDDKEMAVKSKEMVLALADSFYKDLVNAGDILNRRNLDGKRDWFVQQLDSPVKRFAFNKIDELIQALLIVTKKEYATMKTVFADQRSAACTRAIELMESGSHGSYQRLLLSYLTDSSSPAVVDELLARRSDADFVRKELDIVGPDPSMDVRDALKRFKSFSWFTPSNPQLSEIITGKEQEAVRLLMSSSIPKPNVVSLIRFLLEQQSVNARRCAADASRKLVGDEINKLLLEHVNDPDAETAAIIFRILKSRAVPELDPLFVTLVERPEPQIRQAIYDTVPELHAESFASRVGSLPAITARKLGRYVRLVDPNTAKIVGDDIVSPIPVRRFSACAVAGATGLADFFKDRIIELADKDDEPNVRIAALQALSTVMKREALDVIKAFLNDRSLNIRDAANAALRDWMVSYQAQNPREMQ